MTEDVPWFVVAMVVIAFFRWVILKIQGKSATESFDESFFAENEDEQRRASEQTQNRADPTLDPNEEIRKFFQALGVGQAVETPPPPRTPPSAPPPPLPSSRKATPKPAPVVPPPALKKVSRPQLSPADETALRRLQQEGGLQARQKRRSDARGAAARGITYRELIANPENLKTAVILKEILGKPKGLQSLDEFR